MKYLTAVVRHCSVKKSGETGSHARPQHAAVRLGGNLVHTKNEVTILYKFVNTGWIVLIFYPFGVAGNA